MKVYFQLIIANVKEVIRDQMSMIWFVLLPIMFMLVFGAIFYNIPSNTKYNVGLVVEDQGSMGRTIKKAFEAVSAFKLHQGPKSKILKEFQRGECVLVVVIPPYKATPGVSQPLEIPIYYDSGKAAIFEVLITSIRQVLSEVEKEIANTPKLVITDPTPKLFITSPMKAKVATFRIIDFLLPGILAMNLMQSGLLGCLNFVSLRERKIIRRLSATPLSRSVMLWSEITVRLGMALIQVILLFWVGFLVFGVTISGNIFAILGGIILGGIVFIILGYFLVCFTKTENSAIGLIQVLQIPMMFLSGVLFPSEVMANGLFSQIMKFIPLTYLADLLRYLMIGIPSVYGLGTDLAVLVGLLVVTSMLTIRFFKWE